MLAEQYAGAERAKNQLDEMLGKEPSVPPTFPLMGQRLPPGISAPAKPGVTQGRIAMDLAVSRAIVNPVQRGRLGYDAGIVEGFLERQGVPEDVAKSTVDRVVGDIVDRLQADPSNPSQTVDEALDLSGDFPVAGPSADPPAQPGSTGGIGAAAAAAPEAPEPDTGSDDRDSTGEIGAAAGAAPEAPQPDTGSDDRDSTGGIGAAAAAAPEAPQPDSEPDDTENEGARFPFSPTPDDGDGGDAFDDRSTESCTEDLARLIECRLRDDDVRELIWQLLNE